jgi:hypothetical protein
MSCTENTFQALGLRNTYRPDLCVVNIPDTAGGVDVLPKDFQALLLGGGHHDQRATEEIPLGGVGAFGDVIQCCAYASVSAMHRDVPEVIENRRGITRLHRMTLGILHIKRGEGGHDGITAYLPSYKLRSR